MVIKFESYIADIIGEYYEDYETNYKNGYQQNDLEQRVNNYKKVLNILGYFEHYLHQTYIEDKRNFIKVKNIATVEYVENSKGEIIIKNIFFKGEQQGLWYPNKKNSNQVNNNQPNKKILLLYRRF